MEIEFNGKLWGFRVCDAQKMPLFKWEKLIQESAEIVYEHGCYWLVVNGIYGWLCGQWS